MALLLIVILCTLQIKHDIDYPDMNLPFSIYDFCMKLQPKLTVVYGIKNQRNTKNANAQTCMEFERNH